MRKERPLTPHQVEILLCLAKGMTQGQTATVLGVAEATIKQTTVEIMRKLQAENMCNAVFIATSKGLISHVG